MAGSGFPGKRGEKRPVPASTSPTTRRAAKLLRTKARKATSIRRPQVVETPTDERSGPQPRMLRVRGSPTQTIPGQISTRNEEDIPSTPRGNAVRTSSRAAASTPRDTVALRTGSGVAASPPRRNAELRRGSNAAASLSGNTTQNRPQSQSRDNEPQSRQLTLSEHMTPSPSQRRNSLEYRQVRAFSLAEETTQKSIAALGGEITSAEVRVMRKMMDLHRDSIEIVNSIFSAVNETMEKVETLATDVSDLKFMILKENRGIGRGPPAGSSRGQKNSVKEMRKEVMIANPTIMREIDIAFGSKVVCRCAARAVSRYIDRVHSNHANNNMTSRAWAVILFGLRSNLKKKEFKNGIGLEHANFRFGIAKSVVATAKTLTSRAFTVDDDIISGTSQRNSRDILGISPSKPSWLMGNFLDKATLRAARMHHECLRSEIPSLPDSAEKRKALYIGKCAVKIVNDMLRLARDRSRIRMFEAGTCFLADWKSYDCFKDGHIVPRLTFRWPDAEPVNPEVLQDSAVGMSSEIYSRNAKGIDDLISERNEMFIVADYNVAVNIQTQSRVNKNSRIPTVIRSMKRPVNLLRIALVFLSSFSHCNEDALISSHPSMLRTLYRFALVLREIFRSKMEELRETNDARDGNTERNSNRNESQAARVARDSEADTFSAIVHGSSPGVMRSEGGSPDHTNDAAEDSLREVVERRGVTERNEALAEEPNQEEDDDHLGSGGAVQSLADIPPITMDDLLPGDTERDRIMGSTMKLTHEAFVKLLREGHGSSLYADNTQRGDEDFNPNLDSGDDDDDEGDIAVIEDIDD